MNDHMQIHLLCRPDFSRLWQQLYLSLRHNLYKLSFVAPGPLVLQTIGPKSKHSKAKPNHNIVTRSWQNITKLQRCGTTLPNHKIVTTLSKGHGKTLPNHNIVTTLPQGHGKTLPNHNVVTRSWDNITKPQHCHNIVCL